MQCACVVLYFHVWPDQLYNILPHCRISGTIFERNMGYKMYGLIFSTILFYTFLIIRRTEGDVIKMNSGFHSEYSFFVRF